MLLLTLASSGNAQDKKWEHSINVGIGVALDNVKQLTSDVYADRACDPRNSDLWLYNHQP